jgi:hypothetical protein
MNFVGAALYGGEGGTLYLHLCVGGTLYLHWCVRKRVCVGFVFQCVFARLCVVVLVCQCVGVSVWW